MGSIVSDGLYIVFQWIARRRLTLERIRNDAARSITHLFQRYIAKRLNKVRRIQNYLFSPANIGPGTNQLVIGKFFDIYGIARDGSIID